MTGAGVLSAFGVTEEELAAFDAATGFGEARARSAAERAEAVARIGAHARAVEAELQAGMPAGLRVEYGPGQP